MAEKLRILGIDPGSRVTGFGVLDCEDERASYVASGSINTSDGSFADRLRLIFRSVSDIATQYSPDAVAIESIFVHRNAASALKLGHARSAALCATFGLELEVHEYAPREIKLAIVGTGSATKIQVQHMVVALLKLQGQPVPDASDALAAALCHVHQRRLRARLAEATIVAGLR